MKKLFLLILVVLFASFGCQKNIDKQEGIAQKNSESSVDTQQINEQKSNDLIIKEIENLPATKKQEDDNKFEEETQKEENKKLDETDNIQEEIFVSLAIDSGNQQKSFSANLAKNSTVYDLLQKLQKEGKITFQAKNYSFGVFVEGIDEVKNSEKDKKYWMFYVNDKLSESGASLKKLNGGDRVVWKYEKIR